MNNCFVCNTNATVSEQESNKHYICDQCGDYYVSIADPPKIDDKYRSIIRGYMYEHQKPQQSFNLSQEIVNTIQTMLPVSIDEKIHKLMSWMESKTSYPGQSIKSILDNKELVPICYAKDMNEISFFLTYLEERKLIVSTDKYKNNFKITVDGFNYIDSQKRLIKSNLCFCAMSFEEEHKYIYDEFINPALVIPPFLTSVKNGGITRAGFEIQRVDESPHNEGIVDKIMALIRQSKFLIADLSGNKDGVYYEAGFAKGLERPVIFTCEEQYFSSIHFDVRHLNFLKWNKDKIEDAVESLKWRIEGTIGRGTISN